MSIVSPRPGFRNEDYLAHSHILTASDLIDRIDALLVGKKVEGFSPQTIPILTGFLETAHYFPEKELGFPKLEIPNSTYMSCGRDHYLTAISAFLLVVKTHEETTERKIEEKNTKKYLEIGANIIRDLAYWTRGVQTLERITEKTAPHFESIKKFYEVLIKKGESSRRASRI